MARENRLDPGTGLVNPGPIARRLRLRLPPTAAQDSGRHAQPPGAVSRLGRWLKSSVLADFPTVLLGLCWTGSVLPPPTGPPSQLTSRREGVSTRSWAASRMRRPHSRGSWISRSRGLTRTYDFTFYTRFSPSGSGTTTPTRGCLGFAGRSPLKDSLRSPRFRWLILGHCAPSAPCPGMTTGCIWRESPPMSGRQCHTRVISARKRYKASPARDSTSSLQMYPRPFSIWK